MLWCDEYEKMILGMFYNLLYLKVCIKFEVCLDCIIVDGIFFVNKFLVV